jgi:hypothetical protein
MNSRKEERDKPLEGKREKKRTERKKYTCLEMGEGKWKR